MTSINHGEISTVTTLDSVADNALFARQTSQNRGRRRAGKPISVAENEYSIIAISQLMISAEGYLNRVAYLLAKKNSKYAATLTMTDSVQRLSGILGESKKSQVLVAKYEEAAVLRNAIMHAHLYETDRSERRVILAVQKRILHDTNGKYIRHVDPMSYRTKKFKLHVVPSEIGFDDVVKCIKLWNQIYKAFESKFGRNTAYLPPYHPYGFGWYLSHKNRDSEFDAIRLDNDGSMSELLEYLQN